MLFQHVHGPVCCSLLKVKTAKLAQVGNMLWFVMQEYESVAKSDMGSKGIEAALGSAFDPKFRPAFLLGG